MENSSPRRLPAIRPKRTFNLLLAAQSLSAFGDNAAYSVIMGILLQILVAGRMTSAEFGVMSAVYANCLYLPYFVLAPALGWLSDRFEKRSILISANLIKAAGAAIGCAGILLDLSLFMPAYLVIGLGAAVYSPSKYGIIPELNDEARLVKANAAIEMTTIVSILTGIAGGGLLVDRLPPAMCFMILAAVYLSASFLNQRMDRSGIRNSDLAFGRAYGEFRQTVSAIMADNKLLVAVFGTVILWASAAFLKLNLQTWGESVLKLRTMTEISLLAIWLSIGIILGSFLAGRIFKTGEIKAAWKFGLLMGLTVVVMVLFYTSPKIVIGELVLIGLLGGLFVIPLNAVVQARANARNIGKVIAIQNCYENGAMLLSSGAFWLLNKMSLSATLTFLLIGGCLCLVNVLWLRPLLKKS